MKPFARVLRQPLPLIVSLAIGMTQSVAAQQRTDRPTLVVLIAVDQMRPDYLTRFASQYTGEFARMLQHGAVFTRAMQDHANTETAPGHSTMMSGREPTHTGIVSNEYGVPDADMPLLQFSGAGASPQRFNGTTLYDWMRIADSSSRALSVSRKDRGAILPIGRARQSVYWWSNGGFTTSRYYTDSLPAWVKQFDDQHGDERLAGTSWNLLRPAADYAEPDSMPFEHGGRDVVFPHPLPSTAAAMHAQIINYPWMDSLTLAFALRGVHELQIGQRGTLDMLSVSLSATDAIGHSYGPDSREIHDQMLRLDRWLGEFVDSLSRIVPEQRTLLVLTADHGVASFPELHSPGYQRSHRQTLDTLARRLNDIYARRYGMNFGFEFSSGVMLADTAALHDRGVRVDSLAAALAGEVRKMEGVAEVFTPRTLRLAPARDTGATRWRRAIPPVTGWLFAAVMNQGWLWSTRVTGEHGTMNDDDVSVPIVFMGPGVHPGMSTARIRTVDIAPTLAARLGLRPSEPLDGRVVPGVFGQR